MATYPARASLPGEPNHAGPRAAVPSPREGALGPAAAGGFGEAVGGNFSCGPQRPGWVPVGW